jgi:SAM-dependent methyltransferase
MSLLKKYRRLAGTIKNYFRFSPLAWARNVSWFSKDLRWYQKNIQHSAFALHHKDLYPCLDDKTALTPVEPIYFYQDSWAAEKIFAYKPAQHVDIGSAVKTIGIISGFVPVTFIDIRPIEVTLPNLHFKAGTVLALPFEDNTVESISSLCVIEHIGLGRYGDPLDVKGSEKAIAEIVRVTKPGGKILFSVPVDDSCKIYFNAHRAFTPEYVYACFAGCKLIEEKYIYGYEFTSKYVKERGFGVGVYFFEKTGPSA